MFLLLILVFTNIQIVSANELGPNPYLNDGKPWARILTYEDGVLDKEIYFKMNSTTYYIYETVARDEVSRVWKLSCENNLDYYVYHADGTTDEYTGRDQFTFDSEPFMSGSHQYHYIFQESSQPLPMEDGSPFVSINQLSTIYTYNVGDTVLFDNSGDEITIKASLDHAIEMNIRQYVDDEVTTSWLTLVADQTYVVPNGYLEFEFLSTTDGKPIEIETSTLPIQVENPTVTTKTMVKGESSYNKLTIENQRSDNVQVNIHAEDSGLLEKAFTHVIFYEKVSQLDQTFWNPIGQTYLGDTSGSMTLYVKPNEKIVIWNVHRTTRVEYLDRFNIVVREEYEEYDVNANNGLPYYDSGDFTYNPNYDNSGTVEPPPMTESTLFENVYWIYNTVVGLIKMLADGIKMLWNGVGQMKFVMDDLFSFLPTEIRNVLYIGALVGVVKGVFGR